MKIELDLKRHCIETELNRLHNAAISRYFKADSERPGIEAQIVLLEQALRGFDFQQLRSRWRDLSGDTGTRVYLARDDAGTPTLCFGNRSILPPATLV
jgi:hypothetical protein